MKEDEKIFCDIAVEYYFKGYSIRASITKAFKLLGREKEGKK